MFQQAYDISYDDVLEGNHFTRVFVGRVSKNMCFLSAGGCPGIGHKTDCQIKCLIFYMEVRIL